MDEQAMTNEAWDPDCRCIRCLEANPNPEMTSMFGQDVPVHRMYFHACTTCGNKRCPHSDDHRNACTGSNEPGQKGSRY